jgi:competence protein ComEC
MAKNYNKKSTKIITSIFAFIIGVIIGGVSVIYLSLPSSYSIPSTIKVNADSSVSSDINVESIKSADLSIHFMELGNKYTGDSTLIKVGNTEVLVDAGSRSDSVGTLKKYIDNYCTDGKLEYVIVTHAHQDHYAGFSTGKDTQSIFDLYNIGTIVQFAKTNQSETSTLMSNFLREESEVKSRCGTKVYTALESYNNTDGASRTIYLNESKTISINFLYQGFYKESATTENNYSVCFLLNQNNSHYYLFTGDLEAIGEKSLVNNNTLPVVDVYKAGHHGSKTSSSNELLSVIKPKNICVCCCAGSSEYTSVNDNQFPTQTFINNVSTYTNCVYVTSLCVDYNQGKFTSMNGNIVVYCNDIDSSVSLSFSNNTIKLKDTDWFKNNREVPSAWLST